MSNDNEETFFKPPPLTPNELAKLAVFPLPSTVLFPHTFVPLHIFEPRYRVMVTTVIREGGAMGIGMLRPGFEASDLGRPPLQGVAGAGRIVHHNELADGRYMILLRGLSRISLDQEITDASEPFRRFRTAPLAEVEMESKSAMQAVATLQSCVNQLAVTMTEGGAELLKAVSMASTPGALADLLASALIGEPELQQALLETTHVHQRVDKVVAAMAELLLNLPKVERSDDNLVN
jgi:Lon protease-like protein